MRMTNRLACAAALALAIVSPARADILLSEGFGNIGSLAGAGWSMVNNSTPGGSTGWMQGQPGFFPAAAGASDSYIAANFDNASFGGAISNWLITPTMAMGNGTQLDFMLRLLGEGFTDTVQVYLSTNGSSSDVGSTTSSTGDFLQLLGTYSSVDDTGWVAESLTLSGLAGDFSGRLAFRYVVDDTSAHGDYIGIDSVQVSSAAASATLPEPGSLALAGLACACAALVRRRSTAPPAPDAV